jgi:hypothetical protein
MRIAYATPHSVGTVYARDVCHYLPYGIAALTPPPPSLAAMTLGDSKQGAGGGVKWEGEEA